MAGNTFIKNILPPPIVYASSAALWLSVPCRPLSLQGQVEGSSYWSQLPRALVVFHHDSYPLWMRASSRFLLVLPLPPLWYSSTLYLSIITALSLGPDYLFPKLPRQLLFLLFNFLIIPTLNIGLKLTTLRSSVTCSTHWARQAPQLLWQFLNWPLCPNISYLQSILCTAVGLLFWKSGSLMPLCLPFPELLG